jgi:hypothetical protein
MSTSNAVRSPEYALATVTTLAFLEDVATCSSRSEWIILPSTTEPDLGLILAQQHMRWYLCDAPWQKKMWILPHERDIQLADNFSACCLGEHIFPRPRHNL